jgi:hypothetical protein
MIKFLVQNDPQVLAGLIFVGEILDNCQADLVSVMVCILSLSSTEVSSHRMPSPIFKAAARNTDSPSTSDSTAPKFQIPIEQVWLEPRLTEVYIVFFHLSSKSSNYHTCSP